MGNSSQGDGYIRNMTQDSALWLWHIPQVLAWTKFLKNTFWETTVCKTWGEVYHCVFSTSATYFSIYYFILKRRNYIVLLNRMCFIFCLFKQISTIMKAFPNDAQPTFIFVSLLHLIHPRYIYFVQMSSFASLLNIWHGSLDHCITIYKFCGNNHSWEVIQRRFFLCLKLLDKEEWYFYFALNSFLANAVLFLNGG